jgi:Tfp pilus assembly protein PilF
MWYKLGVIVVLLAIFLYLSHRLFKSMPWKRFQLRRASIMAAGGRVEKMLRFLERNRDRSSVSDPLTNALVYFLIRAGSLDRAEDVVNEAMERGDDSGRALAQLGYIAGGRQDTESAESYYRRALEKDESLKSTLNVNLAALLIEEGERFEEAERLLEEALEMREGIGRSGVHLNLAILHMKRDEHRKALVQAQTAYELLPNSEATRRSRAQALALASRAYVSLGEREESRKMASKAMKLLEKASADDNLVKELRHLTEGA